MQQHAFLSPECQVVCHLSFAKKTALLSLICNTQQQMDARFSFSFPHSQNAKACFSITGMLIFSPSLHQTFFFSSPVPFICKHNSKHSLHWDATFYDIVSFFAECSSKPFLHWLSGLSAICLSFTKWSNYEHYCHWAAS